MHRSVVLMFAALISLATALSGCLGASDLDEPDRDDERNLPGGVDPGSHTPPTPIMSKRVDFTKCQQVGTLSYLDAAAVSERLPAGYRASTLGSLFTPVNLKFLSCDAITLDNRTVIHDAHMVYVAAAVSPHENLTEPGLVDTYVFEMFVDNATIANAFSQNGFPVMLANIQMDLEVTPHTAFLAVAGDAWYTIETLLGEGNQPQSTIRREHTLTPEGRHAWFQYLVDYHLNDIPFIGVVRAEHGVLKAFSPEGAGVFITPGHTVEVGGTMQFGFYTGQPLEEY